MSPASRRRTRRHGGGPSLAPAVVPTPRSWASDLQRWWWVLGLVGGSVGALGFQTLPPARRLERVEVMNARQDSGMARLEAGNAQQDSVLAVHLREERAALESIDRMLARLLAGRCAEVGGRLARVYYECEREGR